MSSTATPHTHYVFVIENTGNADFVMQGREIAIANKLKEHSDVIQGLEAHDSFQASNTPLFDGNGNRIGFFLTTTLLTFADHVEFFTPIMENSKGSSRPFILTFDMRNDAFIQNGYSNEIAYVLRQAAGRVEQNLEESHVNDSNGNLVGRYMFFASKSPVNDAEDKITQAAFDSTIYKIDASLMQDHAMYVLPVDDYEMGYGDVGKGYLFEASGEIVDVVEINDNILTKLTKVERESLENAFWSDDPAVIEAHERQYWPDYEPSDELGM